MTEPIGLVIVQRNEGLLLGLNVVYHLSIGVARIVVVDNQSDDVATASLLLRLEEHPRVHVIYDDSAECDQAALANRGLAALLADPDIRWVLPCDADEFLWCTQGLHGFLAQCRAEGILYGTLPWLNHLPEHPPQHVDELAYVRSGWFYTPFAEADWHEAGHFRKAFCARHDGMEIIVGGHYFRREANAAFFGGLDACPATLPATAGLIVHFDLRDCGPALLRKFRDLSTRHVARGVVSDGPWREKERLLGRLWSHYRSDSGRLFADYAVCRRTLRGNMIEPWQLQRRDDVTACLSTFLHDTILMATSDDMETRPTMGR